jgi:predicted metal-dependent peptidase
MDIASMAKVDLTDQSVGTRFDINRHLVAYMLEVPFFAEISRHLQKLPTFDIPTAGIGYDKVNDCFTLFYNPSFMEKQTNLQIRNTLTHEFYHFTFRHLTSRRANPPKMHNIAADAAINSLIVDNDTNKRNNTLQPLPDGCIIPGDWPIMPAGKNRTPEMKEADKLGALIASWPKQQCTEWYFASLQAFVKENPEYAGHDPNCPVHGKGAGQQSGGSSGGQSGDESGEGGGCSSCGKPKKGGKKGPTSKDGGSSGQGEKDSPDGNEGQQDCGSGEGDGEEDGCQCGDGSHSHGDKGPKCTCGCGDYDSFDSHDAWDDVDEDQREYVQNKAAAIVEKAVKHADQQSNGWGNIPANLRDEIRRSVSNIVDWKAVLRNFVGMLFRGSRATSVKKINKKYPYIHPGIKRGYNAKLLVCVDESGSVGAETCELFFAELASLTKRVDIDIVEFDCECSSKDIVPWKKNRKVPLLRKKCGGTCFSAPTAVANDQKNRGRWDGVLILTDGMAPKPIPSRLKRGWVLGPGNKLEFSTDELVVKIEKNAPIAKGAWR